jgi:hypothetical protein
LTRAYTDLNDVFGYLEPQADQEASSMLTVAEAKKGLWYNVNKRKKKGLKPRRPGHPNYPDEKSWEAAKTK